MRKNISKVFALLLVCAMFVSLPLPAKAAATDPPANGTYLFDVTASGFKNELRTDTSSKNFATYQHQGKKIWIKGTMTHSSNQNVEIGLCHKVAPSGYFEYEAAQYWASGTIAYNTAVDNLPTDNNYANAQTYYAYFKNNAGYGSVTGYVKVYSA